MLKGNVIASAIGMYKLGLALGTAIFIAAGTAMYEALAARIAKSNRFPVASIKKPLSRATIIPLNRGIAMAKTRANHPFFIKTDSFSPLVIPISSKNTAKNPLKISVVKGLIPSAWASLAKKPITKLPNMSNTLPLNNACC